MIGEGQGSVSFGFGYGRRPTTASSISRLSTGPSASRLACSSGSACRSTMPVCLAGPSPAVSATCTSPRRSNCAPSTHGVGFAVVPLLEVLVMRRGPTPRVSGGRCRLRLRFNAQAGVRSARPGISRGERCSRQGRSESGGNRPGVDDGHDQPPVAFARRRCVERSAWPELDAHRRDRRRHGGHHARVLGIRDGRPRAPFSRADANSASLFFTGGVSVSFAAWQH